MGADSGAVVQAAMELERGTELRNQWEAFRLAAYKRRQDAKQWDYLPDDKKELDRREEEIRRHYQRAAQLDPMCESAAYESAITAAKPGDYSYESIRRRLRIYVMYLDVFPKSSHAGHLSSLASDACASLAASLDEDRAHVPVSTDRAKLIKEYRKHAVVYGIRHLELICSGKASPGDSGWTLSDVQRRFGQTWDKLATMDISDSEFEEVAARCSRALGRLSRSRACGRFPSA